MAIYASETSSTGCQRREREAISTRVEPLAARAARGELTLPNPTFFFFAVRLAPECSETDMFARVVSCEYLRGQADGEGRGKSGKAAGMKGKGNSKSPPLPRNVFLELFRGTREI